MVQALPESLTTHRAESPMTEHSSTERAIRIKTLWIRLAEVAASKWSTRLHV